MSLNVSVMSLFQCDDMMSQCQCDVTICHVMSQRQCEVTICHVMTDVIVMSL